MLFMMEPPRYTKQEHNMYLLYYNYNSSNKSIESQQFLYSSMAAGTNAQPTGVDPRVPEASNADGELGNPTYSSYGSGLNPPPQGTVDAWGSEDAPRVVLGNDPAGNVEDRMILRGSLELEREKCVEAEEILARAKEELKEARKVELELR